MENNIDINIEEIMEEIRQNIKERGYDKEPLSFEEIEMPQAVLQQGEGYHADVFLSELDFMNHNCLNQFHVPVAGRNPFSIFVKKVIRKVTRFIVLPLVNFQNAYNVSNLRCMNQMKEYMAELEEYKVKIDKLEKELKEMKNKS